MPLSLEQIRERLAARFPDAAGPVQPARDPFVVVAPFLLRELATFLRDDEALRFDFLQDETAVDHPAEELLRVVIHLWSYPHRHGFKLKVELPRQEPRCPSLAAVWPAACWFEREIFDLFGVHFEGHPELRRLLMPDDWVGHPLRKDYREAGGYAGVSNERENPL
ncbi:MAG: NADH-quinone oxidoreductase subunit C, partial [Myxococcales bacterium]